MAIRVGGRDGNTNEARGSKACIVTNTFRESFRTATWLGGSKSVTSNIDAKTVNVSERIVHRYLLAFIAHPSLILLKFGAAFRETDGTF